MKVLVIEDEKMVAESIRAILESKGFEVETVYDGEAGTEYAELGIYDLLILDVMMPKLNGFQVARQVRADRCSTRWTLPPVRWYAEKTASACPPGNLTSCAFCCRARAGCCPRR